MSASALPATGLDPAHAALAADWRPCSERSLERNDPLAGTSGLGERWFLIEVDGSWGRHALLQSRLESELARRLVNRIERARMRPLAIRRPGRRADERRAQKSWRWAIVDARVGRESAVWGVVDDPARLLDVPLDGSTGTASADPIVCVCTHARHDQCCAVKGRQALSGLLAAFPDATWECSHLGGDRFAATMILFPHALHFGRVTADAAAGIVRDYLRGSIDTRFFRGRASLPNVVQAAESFARDVLKDDRVDAFRLLEYVGADGVWSVRFRYHPYVAPESAFESPEIVAESPVVVAESPIVVVNLHETLSEPLLSTCTATVPVPVREFALDAVKIGV